MQARKHTKLAIALALLLVFVMSIAVSFAAHAQEPEQKTVRVGWYDSTYCYIDASGRRCGIAYEYQQKIAEHTGWKYEYVEESWPVLLEMLKAGEIDILSDVSYTEERADEMLFSSQAMGAESYYVYVDADDVEITPDDPKALDGKRVGVNKGSFQEGLLKDWAEKNKLNLEIVELTDDESFSMAMLAQGDIDALVSLDSFGAEERVVPLGKIGSSEYYFAVNEDRPDLVGELNTAMNSIFEENPSFNQQIFGQYVNVTKASAFLAPRLSEWLSAHGPIRIGYRDGYLPFCARDEATGELTGALRDYLAHASASLRDDDLAFETVAYPTAEAALEALENGEVDCVFPFNLSSYDCEEAGLAETDSIMQTEMHAAVRASEGQGITLDKDLTVAVNAQDMNADTFVKDEFPAWKIAYFPDAGACFDAVDRGEVDCALVSSYRVSELQDELEGHGLTTVPTGEAMGLSIVSERSNPELYSVLNKVANMSSTSDAESALASYTYSAKKVTFAQFLRDNWLFVIVAISVVLIIVIVLLLQKLKAERKANEQQKLLEEAAEIVGLKQTISSLLDNMPGMYFTKDAQTGVYLACNQAFAAYAHKRSPDDVVGLTDAEIFDAETARHFVEDDSMALSMDGPYIFFEDVPDAVGNPMHIKTTKLKYTDDDGRLCVLGISLDVTADTVRIRRDSVSTKEAYEKARSTGIIYTHIAQALARGYTDLYHIDLDTEEFIEYRTNAEGGSLVEVRRGWHFFEECQEEARQFVYPEDQEAVIEALDRKTLVAALDQNNAFIMTYRLIGENGPTYVTMKVTRMEDDERSIILGVTDVDEQMRQRDAAARMEEEQIAYARLSALAGDFLCIYIVAPETGHYREFSAAADYEKSFAQAKEGEGFFAVMREATSAFCHPDDRNRVLSLINKENVMADVERHGVFTLSYRLMVEGEPRYVQLKAVMLEEKEGSRLVVGVNDIDTQVRQEEEYVKHLAQAQMEANVDSLTGVKNRHAFLIAEERLNVQIAENRAPEFAIVILDVNDLKIVNDTEGHNAGDRYLQDACKIICNIFKHSPVFRIGGDEFTIIVQGDDYTHIGELVGQVGAHNAEALETGGIVIACGMAKCDDDASVATVFERADQDMYGNKSDLKDGKGVAAKS